MIDRRDKEGELGTWAVIKSVLAAFFGVRNSRSSEADFTKGRPAPFIVAGLLGTVLFILLLVTVVTLILD